MIIQSISNSSLNIPNKQKINFCSANTEQNGVSKPVASKQNKEDYKQRVKKTYWKGVIAGILFSVLVIGGDRLIEYFNKKIPCNIK